MLTSTDPVAHMPEGIRQNLRNDLNDALEVVADMGEINLRQILDILGPDLGPQINAIWDLPALIANHNLQLAPGRALPEPPRPEPPRPERIIPQPERVAPRNAVPAQENLNRVNDIVQARIAGRRRRANEEERHLVQPQVQERLIIPAVPAQANQPGRPQAVRVAVRGPAALEPIAEQIMHAREMDGAARRLQRLHLGREHRHIQDAIDDPGEGRAGAPNPEADVARRIQALENRFLADGVPEGFEIRNGALVVNDHMINENPVNRHPVIQRPMAPQPQPHRHRAALPPVVAPIVLPPGHDEWNREMNCPHQQWRKDDQTHQTCAGCFQVQPNYTLVCNHCAARRCKRCKREMAAGR